MASSGGIVGRGVLLYHVLCCPPVYPTRPLHIRQHTALTSAILVNEEKITFAAGDILFIRSGFTATYDALSTEEQRARGGRELVEFAGVEATEEVAEWLWGNGFAAVVGDAVAWESVLLGGKQAAVKSLGIGVGKGKREYLVCLSGFLLGGACR